MGKLEKISAWNLTKVRSKKEVIYEARTKGAKVHFASLMDTCHWKNAELEAEHQKYKGWVVLRGDIVKDAGKRFPNWECLFVHHQKVLFLSVYVDDIKLAGKKQNLDPMWKLLNKEVDLGEPTSFLDHVYLGCTQRQCEISKNTVDNYRTMFESRISAGGE